MDNITQLEPVGRVYRQKNVVLAKKHKMKKNRKKIGVIMKGTPAKTYMGTRTRVRPRARVGP